MFEPFRCEDCVHGWYDSKEECWYCNHGFDWQTNEKQCEQYYEDDESN